MLKHLVITFTAIIWSGAATYAADLYKVDVTSLSDALILKSSMAEPIARLNDGYLVLIDESAAQQIENSGIRVHLLGKNISKNEIALDNRQDDENIGKFEMLYSEDQVRFFRVDKTMPPEKMQESELFPVINYGIDIEYIPPSEKSVDPSRYPDNLTELISGILEDSLYSYDTHLESYPPRVSGSQSAKDSRDWIFNKLIEFGYDSVVVDTFEATIYSELTECYNIIAYKVGTVMPDHHVIVGAHKDAYYGSPGADDNGSGTCGVLEIARILKDVDTDLTFVFSLYSGEEQGKLGSWHYANEAKDRGDSIVYMFNLDMIGNFENTNDVSMHYGSQMEYTDLWYDLADSLVNLTGHYDGANSRSDHYPFQQNGYQVTFLIEYIFSDYYHKFQDSTVYMNFDYVTRIVKSALATVYTVSQTYVPYNSLAFSIAGNPPNVVLPGKSTPVTIEVLGAYGGTPIQNSGYLHYSINGGEYQIIPMASLDLTTYQTNLPGLSCGDEISYYFSASEIINGQFYYPSPGSPLTVIVGSEQVIIFEDDFETDKSWTATGQWERGTPLGMGGAHGYPDPSYAYSGENVYGYNLSGDYPDNLGPQFLTAPFLDCSDYGEVTLSFMRWLGVERSQYDHASIEAAGFGTGFVTVWENEATISDNEWVAQTIDISEIADHESTVILRWTMGSTDNGWTYCGWNIDDVSITGYTCDQTNDPLAITSESIPGGATGDTYSYQLEAIGGVGNHTWADRDNSLVGTGFSVTSDGLLGGIPLNPGSITFVASVGDDDGNISERQFTTTIELSYKCGDANGDDEVNVGDAVYIINHVFKGGPAPEPIESGDANNDGETNVGDAVYLINHIFKGGPPPCS
ncbi:MAG: M28 family peptidase [candidate division Zixibacteria bacterium]